MLDIPTSGNSAYHDIPGVYAHIMDPNERRRMALAEIDKAPMGWYHLRLVVVTGVGFFTDAYSLFVISLVIPLLGVVYWQDNVESEGKMPHHAEETIKVATSIGTIIGQIFFGYLADVLGRKRMYGVELLIIITCTLAQTLSADSAAISVVGVLVFWRILIGIGVGGDYPLSAVITSEFADTRRRGAMVTAVFSMQGLGVLAAALVSLGVAVAFKDTLQKAETLGTCDADCLKTVDVMWRIILGFGGIPGWFALYYRLTIPETPRYTFDVKRDLEKAAADSKRFRSGKSGEAKVDQMQQLRTNAQMKKYHQPPPSFREVFRYFKNWKHIRYLVGTAGSWFFLDIAFYGLGLNTPTILGTIGFANQENLYARLRNAAVGQIVVLCAGALPGYYMTVALVDVIGRRPIQIGGFLILTILFAVIGFSLDRLSQNGLLALYVLCQFFFNFGPNATTFIVPAECFPTRLRATSHGLSAAAGKVGAVIAQVVFAPMVKRGATAEDPHPWLDRVMQIFALFMFCGLVTSLLIPETKGKTLEELAGEDDDNRAYELRFVSSFFEGNRHASHRSSGSRSRLEGLSKRYFRFGSR